MSLLQTLDAPITLFIVQVIGCVVLSTFLHISGAASVARAFGIARQEIVFGRGPLLWQRGNVQIRLLPVMGYVKFKDTQEGSDAHREAEDAFDMQPRIIQALVMLSGPGVLLLVAVLLVGPTATLSHLLAGFRQWLLGAISPLEVAQNCVTAAYVLGAQSRWLALCAVLTVKVAAGNLLPLGTLNGGEALLALLRHDRTRGRLGKTRGGRSAFWYCSP